VINDFDRFFLNLPPLDKEKDFDSFWDKSLNELKKIPIDPVIEKKERQEERQKEERFEIHNAVFNGAGKYKVKGDLYLPQSSDKPKVIILIHDYNQPFEPDEDIMDPGLAFFFLRLRGHEFFNNKNETGVNNDKEEKKLPGFLMDNILEANNYYTKNIYLDIFRSIDFLRLSNKTDCSSIGLIGKGLGAAAALFAAGFSTRIKSLVLDSPSFCYLELSQNISKSDATYEINSFLSEHQSKKKIIKKNLSYFDAINFADKIKIPILATVGLRDTISPPECVFALFNHLLCEKTMEVYPEDDHNAGGDIQFKKAIQWTKEILLKEEK
jgi:cephalosporin-C deacetylase